MRDYMILTDSCCDLSAQMVDELGIQVMPMRLLLDDQEYLNYLDGREIGFKEFYDRVRGGSMPTTSALNVGEFEEAMRAILETGKDVLYLGFSSGLSTTFQSSVIAADGLRSEFPDNKIIVVDTLTASMGQGLLVYLCAQQKKAGKTIEEVRDYAEDLKLNICHWVTVDDLNHLKRGGRVSAATAAFGTMLNIKPIIYVNEEGKLISVGKSRGRKAALLQVVAELEKRLMDPTLPVFISHGDCEEDAKFVAEEVTKRTGAEVKVISYVGPVIGAHTGAGVIALCFVGKER